MPKDNTDKQARFSATDALPLLIIALIIISCGVFLWQLREQAKPGYIVNQPIPSFSLPLFGSDDVMLSEYNLPKQPFLLNVFASWCASCVMEHPFLTKLHQEQRIPIVGLNWKDNPDKAAKWLEKYGNPYKLIVVDGAGSLVQELGVTGAPETLLVDANGIVLHKFAGPITPEIWQAEFEELL